MKLYALMLMLLASSCSSFSRCTRCQPQLAETIWGFHAARMEATLLAWERGEAIESTSFIEDVAFFEGVTGIELTDKNYFGILPSQHDREFLVKWRSWFDLHKQNLQIVCFKDEAVSVRLRLGPVSIAKRREGPPS